MEQQKPISNVAAGLVIGGILILLGLISIFTGKTSFATISQWLTYVVIIAGLIIFINLHAKSLNYQSTFGNLFSYGFKTTAMFTLVMVVFVVIINMLFPDIRERGFEIARQKLEENPKLTDSQVDEYLGISRKYFWAFAIGGTILGNIIVGAIGSLIGATVTKKRPHNPFEQQTI